MFLKSEEKRKLYAGNEQGRNDWVHFWSYVSQVRAWWLLLISKKKKGGQKKMNSKASCQVHSYEWLMQNELNICYKVQKYSAEAQSFQVR